MNTNYEKIIRDLSSAYEQRGGTGHDELFIFLKNETEEFSYEILKKVVLDDYLGKRGANERLFGAFPKGDIRDLTLKCNNSEVSSNRHLQ